jgi:hypothetical protein
VAVAVAGVAEAATTSNHHNSSSSKADGVAVVVVAAGIAAREAVAIGVAMQGALVAAATVVAVEATGSVP